MQSGRASRKKAAKDQHIDVEAKAEKRGEKGDGIL